VDGYFLRIFIIKYCCGEGAGAGGVWGVGLGNLERNLGSNRGYFFKIGGNIFELGLQLG